MIRSYFGLQQNPFSLDNISLLTQQQQIYDILMVHSHQGGLCLVMGEPGTGKSIIKDAIKQNSGKRLVVVSVSRTLHTYFNILKILCMSFNIEFHADAFRCEKALIQEAFALNRQGKLLITIIDEAHLMDIHNLRKLRLLFEDFPKNHNLILFGQSDLIHNMRLKVNEDIKSRITYSASLLKLNPEDMTRFLLDQMDRINLGHNTFSEEALSLIIRSADGILRKSRNLCISCLIEAARERTKTIDLAIVNRVLIQPHWRIKDDLDAIRA